MENEIPVKLLPDSDRPCEEIEEYYKKIDAQVPKDLAKHNVLMYGRQLCMKSTDMAAKLLNATGTLHTINIDVNGHFIKFRENPPRPKGIGPPNFESTSGISTTDLDKSFNRALSWDGFTGSNEEQAYEQYFDNHFADKEFPVVFIRRLYLGPYVRVVSMTAATLRTLLWPSQMYDVCIIGAGTCGMTAALEASKHQTVALVDWNQQSCGLFGMGVESRRLRELIPKYFLHRELFIKRKTKDWETCMLEVKEKCKTIMKNINDKILKTFNIRYFKGKARILDSNSVEITKVTGIKVIVMAKKLIIATGSEIREKSIIGSSVGIKADTIFHMTKPPGKTLVIGDTMKCFELGAILGALKVDCTLVPTGFCGDVFDKEMVHELMWALQERMNVRILHDTKVTKMFHKKQQTPPLIAEGVNLSTGNKFSECFDTIVLANLRTGRTEQLGLENVGLEVNRTNRKIRGNPDGTTSDTSVFVIGSVRDGHPCLENGTGVQFTLNFMRRLMENKWIQPKPESIAYIVLTPQEYGAVGLSQEKAECIFGTDEVTTYRTYIGNYYVKIICVRNMLEPILGIHVLGHHTSDFLQSFVTSMFKGITKGGIEDLAGHVGDPENVTLYQRLEMEKKSKIPKIEPTKKIIKN